jgi:hypothetical protein
VPKLLPRNEDARVFAPTNRLIVVCPASSASLNDATFKKMINGHPDSKEKTLGVRMGALGKRVTRGTFWQMMVFDTELKMENALPVVDAPQGGSAANADDPKAKKRAAFSDGMNGSYGIGAKASLGSREVRFELIVAQKDGAKSAEFAKKMKESELGKGDEGNPPKWFKDETSGFGDKKIAAQLISNIGFGSDGDLFYVKSAVETADLQQAAGNILGKILGISSKNQGGTGPGAPGGVMPGAPGGVPPGGVPPGGVPPGGPPKMPRRRHDRARR